MGYDDEFRIASTMVPALTTMALPLREMGAAAMTGLLGELSDENDEKHDGGASAERRTPRPDAGPVPAGGARVNGPGPRRPDLIRSPAGNAGSHNAQKRCPNGQYVTRVAS